MFSDLVSVVIPTYNHARYVGDAVDSALAQTNCRVEVIVVNDGSTDDTRDILSRYGRQIRAVHQLNAGLSAARNAGIRHATGEWVSFLDSDDYWHPQKTERQLQAAANAPDVCVIGSQNGDDMPAQLPVDTPLVELTVRDFLCRTPITASSTMVRRRCFDVTGGFDETLRSAEDRDMWLRLAARYPVRQVDLKCWHYRVHPGQMSRNPDRMYQNYRQMLDQFFARHPKHLDLAPLGYGYLYLDAALAYADAGRMGIARRFLAKSILSYPSALDETRWRRAKLLVRFCAGPTLEPLKRLLRGSTNTRGASPD